MDDLYFINVSRLQVRKIPAEPSEVYLSKGSIVKDLDEKSRQYKKEEWIKVMTTSNNPVVMGYVPKKYLTKI